MSERRAMPHGEAIEDSVVALMRRDLARQRATRPQRARTWSAVTAAALAVAAAVVLVTVNTITPTPSYAATPPLLSIDAADAQASDVLSELAGNLRAADSETPGGRTETIRVQTWGLVTNPDGDQPTFVSPENHLIIRQPDGSFDQVVTAGISLDTQGNAIHAPDLPAPGTELWSIHEKPGEHTYLFPDVLPPTAEQLGELIADSAGITEETTANEWLSMITILLMERDLTAHEEATLLELLATLDLEYAGTTVDRLGRDAMVFQTSPHSAGFVERVLVSPAGKILAAETLYTGHDRTDIPSPAVVSYYAWETS